MDLVREIFCGLIIMISVLWLGHKYYPWFLQKETEAKLRNAVWESKENLEDWLDSNPTKTLSNPQARALLRIYLRKYAEYLLFMGYPHVNRELSLVGDFFDDKHWKDLCDILHGDKGRGRELPPLVFPDRYVSLIEGETPA